MAYTLNTTIINPISSQKPKNAVILCHGYGGDGKDISILANYWKNYLTDTIFICPDAPEKCAVSPTGFQWFDLMGQTKDEILTKSLVAEIRLNQLIDEVKKNNNLESKNIAIAGFSQGCMISIQTGLKRNDKINSIIGYSGKIISTEHLSKNIKSRPKVILMHGDKDEVVPIESFLEAKEFFLNNNYSIETKMFKNCEHRIPQEGSSLGLKFIKKNLY
ncbi:MAG: serine esterase [Candidatus Pelagibacter sp.]|nr:serine esterase [Candidatus Pelagibacter sp.]OUW23249.1 MAG: serine esterase [Rickettsiales bacterium TMED174]|tara:strand:- start:137 stop:790 length:654 start_codon:yes stop_codon:yes gene_type:complete